MASPLQVSFVGGDHGTWQVTSLDAVTGPALASVERLDMIDGDATDATANGVWRLRGVVSNERYVERPERERLVARQEPLGRPRATRAALIPIRKNADWWTMTQDERRAILEARSAHIKTGLEYLPDVSRRLHHGRDLGEDFDFLTWFEYPPEASARFEELVRRLRATEEWAYVDWEVDIRLAR